MKKLLTLILCVISISCFAAPPLSYGPYDPGAIRTGGIAKAATGTAAAPAYSFGSDPDTGIYSPGANALGFGVGGADVASLSSTGLSLGTPLSVANGGTGATTAATGLAALGGASLNGSSTVAFTASTINGVAPLTAAEKTQALVGSSTVDYSVRKLSVASSTFFSSGFSMFNNTGTDGIAFGTIVIPNDGVATLSAILSSFGVPQSSVFPQRGALEIMTRSASVFFAVVTIIGNANSVVENSDAATKISTTKDTASSLNVYSVGDGDYQVQNKLGNEQTILFTWRGTGRK